MGKCSWCGGKGQMACLKKIFDPDTGREQTCPDCKGSGKITCPNCSGSGKEPKE